MSERPPAPRKPWKMFALGALAALGLAALVLGFLAYQHPGLLLDSLNLRYCG